MNNLDFNNVSIRGRFIFAVNCLFKVINKFHIATNFDTFIVNLLEYTNCPKMELWETKIKLLLPEELNNKTLSYEFDYDEDLEEEDQKFLTNIFLEVLSVGMANLYKKFENDITLKHVKNIVNLLNKNDLDLPSIDKIKFSSISENDGLGNAFKCKIGYDYAYEYEMHYVVNVVND
ncbi:hypothetical protein [Clostridium felsineum]|uniref:hypothetical protein n=1 Tax=Clostridium felsineum TaxID=36839 RepID=UPI00098C9966|nr:hypothetical protein [Clostridium felsineum]URZ02610.1 hypothetical protein CLAUR_026220 [Clostridium felsineum]